MRRSSFTRKQYEREAPPLVPCVRLGTYARPAAEVVSLPKDNNYRSEAWRRAVASLDCMWCKRAGPSQAAHVNHRGKGMSIKAPDCWTFPLCPDCHREFDQGNSLTKGQRQEFADEWVFLTLHELAKKGLVGAK